MAQTWFWTAVFFMGAGSASFAWLGFSAKEEDKPSHMNSFFLTSSAPEGRRFLLDSALLLPLQVGSRFAAYCHRCRWSYAGSTGI
ncbi:hypothetical protein [Gloeobacter morelensis]|uniref:Uncharacterized protein n=1 Tax=Gloeobacter morelensis MG652769 TaxID=2781736 RepID=A0ABY3PLP3_9CYAN|nr:hypothetical protein [Gloeobacter morelensis]UFP94572.1 hypothetical protein ISF26_23025 [Gloeobacter morelensis MG652769]